MRQHLLILIKRIATTIIVIGVGTITFVIIGLIVSVIGFYSWQELPIPPSEPVEIVEVRYIKAKDGNIYHYIEVLEPEPNGFWMKSTQVNNIYLSMDTTTCLQPFLFNAKSIMYRCEKLDNYSKTHAMALSNDGKLFTMDRSSKQIMSALSYSFGPELFINTYAGIVIFIYFYASDLVKKVSSTAK